MHFCGLIDHLFSLLSITLSYGCLFILHLLKTFCLILQQLCIKLIKSIMCNFLCGHEFSSHSAILNSMPMFSFIRNCEAVFQSGSIISHEQQIRTPVILQSSQKLMLNVFFISSILKSMYWYLTVVLYAIPYWYMMLNIFSYLIYHFL